MKTKKKNCPYCGLGNISFKTITEVIFDNTAKERKIGLLVGICDNCGDKVYPKESALMIERITKPSLYTLELPGDIVDRLIISAKKEGKDFRRYALEKLAG